MVINAGGLVLTNNHVIDGSTKITATVASTGKTYPATVVGYDKTGDVALIQLRNASRLTTVPIGNSSAVRAGNMVVAMGNAEGQGTLRDLGEPVGAAHYQQPAPGRRAAAVTADAPGVWRPAWTRCRPSAAARPGRCSVTCCWR
jgi:S1-C subfamily serine protease